MHGNCSIWGVIILFLNQLNTFSEGKMILYQLKCKDLGFDSCNFVATGNSENEIKRKIFLHASMNHDEEYKSLAEEQKNEMYFIIRRTIDLQSY